MEKYQRAWPTMVTPYNTSLQVDRSAYRTLVDWYINHNAGGLYANCATSEMDFLTVDERLNLVTDAVETAGGRVPVAATGNLGDTIDDHIAFCQQVADAGADVVMLITPDGFDSDDKLETYYMTIAEQVNAPLGLYERPSSYPYLLSLEVVKTLATTGRFVAYKETSCELEKIIALLEITKHTALSLLQANTPFLLEFIKAGGIGSMSIASAFVPDMVSAVIEKGKAGAPEVDSLQQSLCTIDLAQRSVHPCGTKYLLSKRGVPIDAQTRRTPHTLSSEQLFALDRAAELWFDPEGNIRQMGK